MYTCGALGGSTRSARYSRCVGAATTPSALASRRSTAPAGAPPLPEHAFEHVFEEALDVILLIDPLSGEIVRANRAVERCLGYSPARVAGRHFSILFPAEVWSTPEELLAELRAHGPQFGEQQFQRADGSVLPHGSDRRRRSPGATRRCSSRPCAMPASACRQRTRCGSSEERLELVLRGADLGLWDWNVETDEVALQRPRAAEIVGYELGELEPHARTWDALVHPDDKARVRALMNAHLLRGNALLRVRASPAHQVGRLGVGAQPRQGGEPRRPGPSAARDRDAVRHQRAQAQRGGARRAAGDGEGVCRHARSRGAGGVGRAPHRPGAARRRGRHDLLGYGPRGLPADLAARPGGRSRRRGARA